MGDRIAVMKEGLLQQVGSPEELHNEPANLFVASFIGSPAMNFFPAKVMEEGGRTYADAGFVRVPLAASTRRPSGRDVVVGIRPEDINTTLDEAHAPVSTHVEVVEFLGSEFQLHLRANGSGTFVARVPTDTRTQPGADLRVGFDTRKVHVFDKQTEEALS